MVSPEKSPVVRVGPEPASATPVRTVLMVFLAAVLAALVLAAVGVVLNPELARGAWTGPGPVVDARVISGARLQLRAGGTATFAGDALQVAALDATGRAVVTGRVSLRAEDFAMIEITAGGYRAGNPLFLIWRTRERPDRVSSAPLALRESGTTAVNLARHPDWQGELTELGLDIYGEPGGQGLRVHSLRLEPPSAFALLRVVASEWLFAHRWSQRSINFLRGTPANSFYSPVAVVAVWVALAALAAWVLLRRRVGSLLPVLVLLGLGGWMALDALWSYRLSGQVAETRSRFAGKSQQERQLADMDGALYRQATRLRSEFLPPSPARVLILSAATGHDYRRLRMQYHLLPHNIYNYGAYPLIQGLHPGTYILVLGEVDVLEFTAADRRLRWLGHRVEVERLDAANDAVLYRVTGRVDE